jgi:hypothetical protein
MSDPLKRPPITDEDYAEAAHTLGCQVAAVKAVAEVESSGSGFLSTGELVILFEPHVFWKRLVAHKQDPAAILKEVPEAKDILYPAYRGHSELSGTQWERLRRAANLPGDCMAAAYESASFGKFQIMGFNVKAAGYSDVFEFVHFLDQGERYHLHSFVQLIKSFGLAHTLAQEDWAYFARSYNGPAFRGNPSTIKDDYDYKLAQAFKKHSA